MHKSPPTNKNNDTEARTAFISNIFHWLLIKIMMVWTFLFTLKIKLHTVYYLLKKVCVYETIIVSTFCSKWASSQKNSIRLGFSETGVMVGEVSLSFNVESKTASSRRQKLILPFPSCQTLLEKRVTKPRSNDSINIQLRVLPHEFMSV